MSPGGVVDDEQMRLAAHRAVEMAERLDNTELLSLALDVEHITYEVRDDVKAMAAGAERRQRLADQVHAIVDLDDIFYMSAQVYWEQGRYEDARLVSEEGVSRVTALGGHAMGSSATLAISRFLLGDWDAALEEGQRIRERFGDSPPGFLRVAWGVTEYVLSSRGQFAEVAPLRDLQMATPMRLAFRALGLAAEGRLDEAWEQFPLARLTIGVAFELQAKARLLQMAGTLGRAGRAVRRHPRAIGAHRLADRAAAAARGEAAIAMANGDAARAAELPAQRRRRVHRRRRRVGGSGVTGRPGRGAGRAGHACRDPRPAGRGRAAAAPRRRAGRAGPLGRSARTLRRPLVDPRPACAARADEFRVCSRSTRETAA